MLHAIYTNGVQKKSKDFIDPIPRQFQDVEVKAVTCSRDCEEALGKERWSVAQIGDAHAHLKNHKPEKHNVIFSRDGSFNFEW